MDEIYDDEADIAVSKGFGVFKNQVDLGQLRGQTLGDCYRQGDRTLERHVDATDKFEGGDDYVGFHPGLEEGVG